MIKIDGKLMATYQTPLPDGRGMGIAHVLDAGDLSVPEAVFQERIAEMNRIAIKILLHAELQEAEKRMRDEKKDMG